MNKFVAIILLGVAAVVGFFLPPPMPTYIFQQIRFVDSAMAVCLGVFVWGAFHLAEPAHHGRHWLIIRDIAIPIIWLVLVSLIGIWFHYLSTHNFHLMAV